ncbi:MAG: bifunctional UDP-sugar hydrolase/5'-nucleotidase [Candidatus Aureabacteria bacterium]|nr:bifunctional UDP-sugar hydrolase/5'-nucleotidase [Candidatus Auribacterota bacterium]
MKKCFAAACAVLLITAFCGCATRALVPVCILHTNDVHGHIAVERVEGWRKRLGGAAVLAGCVRGVREENRRAGIPTLLLDGGDIFVGTPEGSVSGGRAVTEVMNAVGYDAMAVGNHEFDMGIPTLEALAASARFPFLGANILNSATMRPPPFLTPYLVKECGALKTGIIGIITDSTPEIVMPGRTEKVVFTKPERALQSCMVDLAGQGARFIVVLSHCGLEEDRRIAASVKGIGVIVGSHDHTLLTTPVRVRRTGTLILQAGGSGLYLGKLDARVDPADGRVRRYRYTVIPLEVGRCSPDPAVGAIVKGWTARTVEQFDRAVGAARTDLPIGEDGESALGDVIADSMCAGTGAAIAFHNSYGIRNPILKGTITYRDIYKVMPFENTLYTMTLNGAQIRKILEASLAGQILHVAGVRVEYASRAPAGKRILAVTAAGKALDAAASYRVVTNSFLAQGGDGFTVFCEGREVRNSGVLDRDAMADYIRAHSPLSAEGFAPQRIVPR